MLLWPDFSHENSFFFSSVFLKRREWGLSLQVDNCRYYDAVYGEEGEEGVMHPREHFYTTFSLGKKRRKNSVSLATIALGKKAVSHRLTSTPEKLPKHFSSQSIRPSPKWARAEAGGRMWAGGGKRCSIMARQSGGKRRRERMPPEEEEEEGASSSSLLFQKVTVAGARPKKNDCSFLPFLRPI